MKDEKKKKGEKDEKEKPSKYRKKSLITHMISSLHVQQIGVCHIGTFMPCIEAVA